MKDAIRRSILENAVESSRVPQRIVKHGVCRISRIGLTAAYRADFDAATTKRVDEMSSDESLADGYNGATHDPEMYRDLLQTYSGQEQNHLAAQCRAKRNRHGSKSHCRCWLLSSVRGLACRGSRHLKRERGRPLSGEYKRPY